jgi:hypothetical protein
VCAQQSSVKRSWLVAAALESYLHVVREWLEGLLGPESLFPWYLADLTAEDRGESCDAVGLIQLREVPDVVSALEHAASQPNSSEIG